MAVGQLTLSTYRAIIQSHSTHFRIGQPWASSGEKALSSSIAILSRNAWFCATTSGLHMEKEMGFVGDRKATEGLPLISARRASASRPTLATLGFPGTNIGGGG